MHDNKFFHKLKHKKYTPSFEGYTLNFIKKNYWKVRNSMEFEDVLQQAYSVFLTCVEKYKDVEQKHLMALYKRMLYNEFVDLAKIDSCLKNQQSTCEHEGEELDYFNTIVDRSQPSAIFLLKVKDAPDELKTIINTILNAPLEVLQTVESAWSGRNKRKKYQNNMLCELFGINKKRDIVMEIKNYFLSTN